VFFLLVVTVLRRRRFVRRSSREMLRFRSSARSPLPEQQDEDYLEAQEVRGLCKEGWGREEGRGGRSRCDTAATSLKAAACFDDDNDDGERRRSVATEQ
jgi:hypothetical protein